MGQARRIKVRGHCTYLFTEGNRRAGEINIVNLIGNLDVM